MTINRREFLIMGAGLLAGCATGGTGVAHKALSAAAGARTIDAGAAEAYGEEGVYDRFRYQGFFLVRRGGRLFALSSACTHRDCTLNLAQDRSFTCPCHGSAFDADGSVTKGPAQRSLPQLPVRIDAAGRVLVQVPES